MSRVFSRGAFTAATAAAFAGIAIVRAPARAAQFSYKLGHSTRPTENLHLHLTAAADAIRTQSAGRLDIQIFPSGQLGTDAATAEEVRSGAVQMAAIPAVNLSESVPLAGIDSTAFAFRDHAQAQHAMDGPLGDFVIKTLVAAGYHIIYRPFDLDFRQVTSGTHAIKQVPDFADFKIRVATSKIMLDLFKTLGASPTPIDLSALYVSLQTKLVDGLEISPSAILGFKFYEVQKYMAITNHAWSGFWLTCNPQAWSDLPPDLQTIATRNFTAAIIAQRKDMVGLSAGIVTELGTKGLATNAVDPAAMRAKLQPYYKRWRAEFGNTAWALLEQTSGKLG
jgi:tripartite ATP-independent transporter DctP family solute receptor